MNKLLIIMILIFSLQSWTRADDIKDFDIEGKELDKLKLKHLEN